MVQPDLLGHLEETLLQAAMDAMAAAAMEAEVLVEALRVVHKVERADTADTITVPEQVDFPVPEVLEQGVPAPGEAVRPYVTVRFVPAARAEKTVKTERMDRMGQVEPPVKRVAAVMELETFHKIAGLAAAVAPEA